MGMQTKKRRPTNEQPRPNLAARLLQRRNEQTRLLAIKLRGLMLNDALVCGRLRLIWIQPTRRRYFVLYAGQRKIGKVEVRADYPSTAKLEQLAALLVLAGFTARKSQIVPSAVLRFPRRLNRVPNLFTLSDR
jgi:hypothetical protein